MSIRRFAGICLFVFSVGAGSFSPLFAAEPLNRIVAIVNNEVITLHELNVRIKEMTGMSPEQLKGKSEEAYLDARQQILEFMIDEKISEAKIKELDIKVTDKQVDDAVERIKKENQWTQEDLLARLQGDGMPYDKFRERIKKDLQRTQLIDNEVKSKIIITEDRIKRYYEEHRAEYAQEGKVYLAGIFLVRKAQGPEENERLRKTAEEIEQRLKQGEDFRTLAKKYSEGPSAEDGGDLGSFKVSQLEPDLQKVLRNTPVGGYSDPIVKQNGVQIIRLVKKEGGEEKSLDQVRDAIFSAIYREEVNQRYTSWIKELRERSYTKITF